MIRSPREYLSDDRDLRPNKLVVMQAENGDWYVSIVKIGDRLGPCVRLTTSGAPSHLQHVAAAVHDLYRALGGEEPMARESEEEAVRAAWWRET